MVLHNCMFLIYNQFLTSLFNCATQTIALFIRWCNTINCISHWFSYTTQATAIYHWSCNKKQKRTVSLIWESDRVHTMNFSLMKFHNANNWIFQWSSDRKQTFTLRFFNTSKISTGFLRNNLPQLLVGTIQKHKAFWVEILEFCKVAHQQFVQELGEKNKRLM